MKKSLPILLLASILWLLASPINAQEENYDAVYLKLKKEYTLNPDGSMDYHYLKQLKLQTYRSFNSLYGETFIVYNPAFQKLKINDVYTIMADGKKVVAPQNAFNEVLPGFAANAPYYNGLREMVVTHPATERNAVLNIDYEIHTAKGFYPALMGNEVLTEYEPVRELEIIIRVPEPGKLDFKLLNLKAEPVVTRDGNMRVFTWSFRDLPAISAEEFQAGGYDLYPRLIFSTAMDRETIYAGFLKQPAFSYQLSDEMKKFVSGFVTENKEETDRILKLQEKVVNELRLTSVPLRYTGFTCRNPADAWKSNYGTPAEKAVLLVALLKEAGIEAEPVFVIRESLWDEHVGSLLDMEDIAVKAMPKSADAMYLSVSNLNPQSMKMSLPGRMLVSLRPGQKVQALKTTSYLNSINGSVNLTIGDKREMNGEIAGTFLNNCDPWLAMLRDKGKLKSYVGGGLSSGDLKDQKVVTIGPQEAFTRYTVKKEKPFIKDSNFLFYSLPYFTNGIESFGMKLLPKTRTTALEIPWLVEEIYEISFMLPEDLKVLETVKNTDLSNKAGNFSFSMKQSGKNVVVKREIKLAKTVIESSEYADFKALMDLWNSDNYRKIVFSE